MEDSYFIALTAFIGITLLYKVFDWLFNQSMLTNHSNRYILITGCDSGFGYKAARDLDMMGCHVFAGCLTQKGIEQFKGCTTTRLHPIHLDVTDPQSVRDTYRYVCDEIPPDIGLWGLLNNAGKLGNFGQSDWLNKEDYQEVMEVNFFGAVHVIEIFLPLVKMAKGRIVNTSSVIACFRLGGTNPYTASKCALSGYSDGLRREMYHFNVSVHLIEPGVHRTNFMREDVMEKTLRDVWARAAQNVTTNEYGDAYLDQAVHVMLDRCVNGLSGHDLSPVVNCYKHALFASKPRVRYHPGWDARYLWLPLSKLPDWLADVILRKLERLAGVPRPLVARK